ncbi:hypothetical protein EQW78_04270 [Oerskovia turbata]|uniref:Uncharacterized protein n=1 Tax=Oerskovia turbata TaxID=1713 RepID=A0A4Q1L1Q6_9CELL|nr:hypothetical protein [Oerskovia turbata]RXR28001.1 hypothetical protein EQW73_01485 [Oerskovia turbata]RXR35990.1 hypothetical protein EQW78_04270 [Oerskovia turbata]
MKQGAPPAVDASGALDLGSFDEFDVSDGTYTLSGDFGQFVIESGVPTIEIRDDKETATSAWTPPSGRDR